RVKWEHIHRVFELCNRNVSETAYENNVPIFCPAFTDSSAGGLRDFSRIAASNEIMWRDIFFANKENVSKAINLFINNLNTFKKDISKKNNKSILKKLVQTKKVRSKIIKLKQDINKPNFGRD
ncbi:prephenate dehydrogenase/arogenate dehydrogenase family protein, partial [Pelagibacterales bacterium SAG-MED12]|nr:prephenate dehydrogenase/arogenate dehydrogenase family protein [Pelagibacterales bacterium SAG-MED12]